jgi:hypothetical protein
MARRDVARELREKLSIPRNEAYALVQRLADTEEG